MPPSCMLKPPVQFSDTCMQWYVTPGRMCYFFERIEAAISCDVNDMSLVTRYYTSLLEPRLHLLDFGMNAAPATYFLATVSSTCRLIGPICGARAKNTNKRDTNFKALAHLKGNGLQPRIMASNLLAMASKLLVMASNLLAMASKLLVMASKLIAMAS